MTNFNTKWLYIYLEHLRRLAKQALTPPLTLEQKAFAVLAKYPTGSVLLFAPAEAKANAAGTIPVTNGSAVQLWPDHFGNLNATQSNQGSSNPTYSATDESVSFTAGCKPFILANPFLSSTDDFTIVCGYAASGSGNAAAMSLFALSATKTTNKYGRLGSIEVTPTQIIAEWYADTGADFQAKYTIPAGTYNTPRVVGVRKTGKTGALSVNGSQVATVDLTNFAAFTGQCGYIAQSFLNDTAQYQGKETRLIAVKASVSDADYLILQQYVNSKTATGVNF